MRTAAFVALVGCLLSWTVAASAQDRIAWVADWRDARDLAQQQHRLVLLHFYSDACSHCKDLERNVFPRPEVARAMSTGYVAVKINISRFPQLRDHYKIDAVPADIIVTAEGKEISRSVPSPGDPNRYIAMLDLARAQYGVGSHGNTQIAERASTRQPANRYGSGGFGAGVASNATTNRYGDSRVSNFGTQPKPTTEQRAYVTNQYADGLAPHGPAQANVSPRYGDAFPGPSAAVQDGAPPYGESPRVGSNTAPQGNSQINPYAQRQPQDQFSNPPTSNDRLLGNQGQATRQQVAPPTNTQFAMDGFCPVTLVDHAKWQEGDTRWGAVHQGKTYLFARQQGQQKFLASPDRFAPILSGYDPVYYAEKGQLIEGKREHGVFFANRIFLFADEVALDRFSKNTEFYMARVREASLSPRQQRAIR